MESMSHDPAAGDIGSQLVDMAMQGLDSGSAVMMQLTSLIPAGAEEVSMQAAMSFVQEAAQMLASNTAAQQELMSAGMSLIDIAQNYGNVDSQGAESLVLGGPLSGRSLAGGSGASVGARLAGAHVESLPGAAGSAAARPLMANFAETFVSSAAAPSGGTAGTIGNAANAASSALGTGAAPLGAVQGAASGSSRPGMPASFVDDKEESDPTGRDDLLPGERQV
jgi:hypothetical protein